MWSKYFVLLTGFLLLHNIGNSPCLGDRVDTQFPLGTIGCLFSDLCVSDEICQDDYLFGTCSSPESPDDFAYTLTEQDLLKLGKEIDTLKVNKLTWADGYTQCILQNVVISLLTRIPFSKKLCYELLEPVDPVEEDIDATLADLWARTVELDQGTPQLEDFALLPNSQKRDEIIKVHKYFDKSKSIHKRTRQDPFNYLSYYPSNDDDVEYYPSPNSGGMFESQNEPELDNEGLTLDDLHLIESYLESELSGQRPPSKLSQLLLLGDAQGEGFGGGPAGFEEGMEGGYSPMEVEGAYSPEEEEMASEVDGMGLQEGPQPGYMWEDSGDIYNTAQLPQLEEAELPDEVVEEPDLEEAAEDQLFNALPPDMANKLDQLIGGDIQAGDLSDDELGYLSVYVTKMLEQLGDQDQVVGDLDPAIADNAMEMDMAQGNMGVPFGTEEEDMNMGEMEPLMADVDAGDMGDMMMSKKAADPADGSEEEEEGSESQEPEVDIAWIRMDKNLNEELSKLLMDAVQRTVSANPGSLSRYLSKEKTLQIFVDPILAGINATQVAEQARTHKAELEAATGLKFEDSGYWEKGKDALEAFQAFKATDDRYFVLTFVLCGCIAGILLAVIVIYLIRRNSQSREKLQQIAATQEGSNEAASKDYQDLCRQRMQSKSSEKPEPLHAASRVGSVSESQVRSPSSRSSTSSCKMDRGGSKDLSEEPVNSNMDISTGHIVLSYMEDHLKNKDRLEREWEAMVAYEADPSSTKVAEDPANTRKNRYADVLPYDHSRVVLTTNTNVSGSDYINASTITDHDPRNPAYVATQGPLPHTVADFWQMVWEQGSVVIVMLTKLKEDGEDKSHRYWPEEGSDLYHIYEVHLVSEHNWCEDYIVRSFYLKNLQTSETRTVTQFHFLTWPDLGIPTSMKALLDFRRKVNKSYRGRSCPIVVHCSEGCGRTGTYTLIDMVLNRMAKGAKEIDIAATLEHIRDQRMNMAKTKEQFQFALAAVAEEVHAILKALPQ